MFGRGRKNSNDAAPSASAPAGDKGLAEAEENGKTIIAEHIAVEGYFRGRQDLVVEGMVKGIIEIQRHDLEVRPRGRVEAEIRAQNVSIQGRLRGSVEALEKVIISRQAEFFGNIKTRRLAVEDGAGFKGMIELVPQAAGKED